MSLRNIEISVKKIKALLMDSWLKRMRRSNMSADRAYIWQASKAEQMSAAEQSAYTMLIELCVVRALEERGLISPALKRFEGYYSRLRDQSLACADQGSDLCHDLKMAITAALDEMADDIKAFFESDGNSILAFIEDNVIKEIAGILLCGIPREDWMRDDIIGWVYRYFVDDQKEQLKASGSIKEITAKSQIYTYDWIVKYIVDNTLGAYWEDMKNSRCYRKSVADIKLLDPACGCGSFLVYAFDKFYDMYIEEGLLDRAHIPNYIITRNLYGMDIDHQAVRWTALSLCIKAKTKVKDVKIDRFNIICTAPRIKNGSFVIHDLAGDFVDGLDGIEEIIQRCLAYIDDNNILGSLMKLEDIIEPIVEECTKGLDDESKAYAKARMLEHLDYAINCIYRDIATDCWSSVRGTKLYGQFIAAMSQKYDVIVSNPPYLNNRKMPDKLRIALSNLYPDSKTDLYAAFIDRGIELLADDGYMGYITPDTYIFITSFKELRRKLLSNCFINKFVHLGKNAFKSVNVSTAILILQKGECKARKSVFYDIQELKDKQAALTEWDKQRVYVKDQSLFNSIDGAQFMYHVSDYILHLLISLPPLNPTYGVVKQGLATGSNNRFVYMRWEVPPQKIGLRWIPYAKGGGYNKYLSRGDYVIDWADGGRVIKDFKRSVVRNEEYYFRQGITFSLVAYDSFSARYMPEGWIFDVGGSCVFPSHIDLYYLLGFMNSKLACYFMTLFNPTVNFQVGDLSRLPIKEPSEQMVSDVGRWVRQILDLKRQLYRYDVLSEFYQIDGISEQLLAEDRPIDICDAYRRFWHKISECLIAIEEMACAIDDVIFALYGISDDERRAILKRFGYSPTQYPMLEALSGEGLNRFIDSINKLSLRADVNIVDIACEIGLHPRSVLAIMEQNGLYLKGHLVEAVKRYIQTLARQAFKEKEDGIVILEDMVKAVQNGLYSWFGSTSVEIEIKDIIGKDIESWLRDDFADDYINNTGYDRDKGRYKEIRSPWEPLIWKGQSKGKCFTAFVWRYKISPDTALKIKDEYLGRALEQAKAELRELDAKLAGDVGGSRNILLKQKEQLLYKIKDLTDYGHWIAENGIKLRGMEFIFCGE